MSVDLVGSISVVVIVPRPAGAAAIEGHKRHIDWLQVSEIGQIVVSLGPALKLD